MKCTAAVVNKNTVVTASKSLIKDRLVKKLEKTREKQKKKSLCCITRDKVIFGAKGGMELADTSCRRKKAVTTCNALSARSTVAGAVECYGTIIITVKMNTGMEGLAKQNIPSTTTNINPLEETTGKKNPFQATPGHSITFMVKLSLKT